MDWKVFRWCGSKGTEKINTEKVFPSTKQLRFGIPTSGAPGDLEDRFDESIHQSIPSH